jgi:lipoic acid synthetase
MTHKGIRKPDWLKVRNIGGPSFEQVDRVLKKYDLNTVCRAANCPNRGECFNLGTATFLIMGPTCTRNCRFCDIRSGLPAPLDPAEPDRVAAAAAELELSHVVITSVTRDDLPDGGAGHFAAVVGAVRRKLPKSTVEILTPDFRGAVGAVDVIINCPPDVFNHNVETVPRLYAEVRPLADYASSLALLQRVAEESGIIVKSGIIVGLGETYEELEAVFSDLAHSHVSILTIGQYLAPSRDHYPVCRYLTPGEFEELAAMAGRAGIGTVISAPLVRSSYHAARLVRR